MKQFRWLVLILAVISVLFFAVLRSFQVKGTKIEEGEINISSKEELGRRLFFDTRLSSDETVSCATCHIPEKAFTDGKVRSEGVGGQIAFRNAPSLLNLKDASAFMFDAHVQSLEEQALVPIQDSLEMNSKMGDLIKKLRNVKVYNQAAQKLFGREFDAFVLTRSLASFQRTLVSNNSSFDEWNGGEEEAVSADVKAGWQLFNDLQCIECHSLPHFTDYQAHHNGVYWNEERDQGKFRIQGDSSFMGAFKTPSLRNVELTAPYMHDGSIETLEEVVNHYLTGGNGSPHQDERIIIRNISTEERNFLLSFLHSLTDTTYLVNYR